MFTRIRKFLNDHVATSLVLVFVLCGVAYTNLTSHTEALLDALILALDSDADGDMTDETWFTNFTAAIATTVTITDNEDTSETNAIIFSSGGDLDGGNMGLESDGDLNYDPATGIFTAPLFSGDGSGLSNVGASAEVYGSDWNGNATIPAKNDIYDYLHQIDTDDDGDIGDEIINISDNWEVQDNVNFSFGNNDDVSWVWITANAAEGIAASLMLRNSSNEAVAWFIPGSNSFGMKAIATPGFSTRDSDSATNDTNLSDIYEDQWASEFAGNQTDTTEDAEITDAIIYAMPSGAAGTKTDVLHFDGSDSRWETAYQIQHYDVTTEVIPIGYMTDGASAPDALATLTSGTDKVDARTFAGAADEDLQFTWEIPADLDTTSGIKFRIICFISSATGPSGETWQFELQGFSLGDGDALDGTNGTAQTSNSGSRTDAQYDRVSTAWSSAMTSTHITNLAVGETASFKLYRDVDDTDDYVQNVAVSAIEFKYKRKHDITF